MRPHIGIDHRNHYGFTHGLGVSRFIRLVIARLLMIALFSFFTGWILMLLWNWLLPMLFGIKTITFLQGVGILIFSKLLLSGFHGGYHQHDFLMQHHNRASWIGEDDWVPAGDYRNWKYYREYWKKRGKSDFEAYLKNMNVNEVDENKKGL